jgi:hypothetical protein
MDDEVVGGRGWQPNPPEVLCMLAWRRGVQVSAFNSGVLVAGYLSLRHIGPGQ